MTKCLFRFYDPGDAPDRSTFVASIPQRVNDKRFLLNEIATQLQFPNYFGFNWDALDECLSDLSWIEGNVVCIWHSDCPLLSTPKEAHSYLSVLDGVLRAPGPKRLIVYFPMSAQAAVKLLLGQRSH
jgi:Barstar (barnase inhibitor)